jgi:NADPH-dependent curcumin reductase CurA
VDENRRIVIAALPNGPLQQSDFETRTEPIPEPGEGEVLCRTLALTIGAGQRAGLQGSASYAGAAQADTLMTGTGAAVVVASNDANFSPGDHVTGPTGWQNYAALPGRSLTKIDVADDPALHLGTFGTNGLTAYFGLLDVGQPQAGETVVVSAAAGSVGHMVGQIAKALDCQVVGVAGSEEKCAILVDELGFDVAVNYKSPDFRASFKAATADRIDVYFDNTGGDILASALFRMNTHGRIVCCGVVSQYDTSNPAGGPRGVPGLLVNNRVRMQGFLVFDYAEQFEKARGELRGWIGDGRLRPRITEFSGLEQAPTAFIELLGGGTVGTTIVRVS